MKQTMCNNVGALRHDLEGLAKGAIGGEILWKFPRGEGDIISRIISRFLAN